MLVKWRDCFGRGQNSSEKRRSGIRTVGARQHPNVLNSSEPVGQHANLPSLLALRAHAPESRFMAVFQLNVKWSSLQLLAWKYGRLISPTDVTVCRFDEMNFRIEP